MNNGANNNNSLTQSAPANQMYGEEPSASSTGTALAEQPSLPHQHAPSTSSSSSQEIAGAAQSFYYSSTNYTQPSVTNNHTDMYAEEQVAKEVNKNKKETEAGSNAASVSSAV